MTRFVVFSLLLLAAGTSMADEVKNDPLATEEALGALLAAANEAVPASSSCHALVAQPGRQTLGGLLATRLAYLYAGDNVIRGACVGERCWVQVTHAAGEDVASAELRFIRRGGRAVARTLACVMTP